jgi:hypothetical protein
MAKKIMMPAGQYYIGDLCYVMDDVWDEFCDITTDGQDCLQGKFTLADGREFVTFSTRYGDGEYPTNTGARLGVDAGLIGCIATKDIDMTQFETQWRHTRLLELGTVVTFKVPFSCHGNQATGRIRFGHVLVRT